MTMQKYNINILVYQTTQFVSSECNSITFINYGTSVVTIQQGIVLANGQSFTIEGNENELCIQQFLVTFGNTGTNNCTIVKKNYTN